MKPRNGRLRNHVDRQVRRRVRARRHPPWSLWRGLGFMGMVGWSVAMPMLLGALLGRWLDQALAPERSMTLVLMLAGLALGCWNAFAWVSRERRDLEEESRDG